eukprot:947227-Amphidinium_carterae.1
MREVRDDLLVVTLATHSESDDGITQKPWQYVHITDPSLWISRVVCVCAPVCWHHTEVQALNGMTMTVCEQEVTLLEAAAGNAFRGMTVEQLKWMARSLGFNLRPMPTLERELVTCCMMRVLPELSPESDEFKTMFAKREYRKQKGNLESVIDEDTVKVLDTTLDIDEMRAADVRTKPVKQPAARVTAATSSTGASSSSAVASSSIVPPPLHPDVISGAGEASGSTDAVASAVQPKRKLRTPFPKDGAAFTVDEARALLPSIATLVIHTDRCWQCKVPTKPTRPKSCTGTWGANTNLTYNGALKKCLQWAWQVNEELNGTPADIDWSSWPE